MSQSTSEIRIVPLSVPSTISIGGFGRTIWSRRERMDRMDESVHQPTENPREAAMTDAERRIIEFLITSNATKLADLPDWFLALLEGDVGGELSHELITAASLMFVRRERPGIKFGTARELLASYAADPTKLEELAARITAFRLSCCFERLKRSGRYEDVSIDDPFDPEGRVSVKLTEGDWQYLNSNPTEGKKRSHLERHWNMN